MAVSERFEDDSLVTGVSGKSEVQAHRSDRGGKCGGEGPPVYPLGL